MRSSQVSATRVKGAGTNLTYILLGYFPDWIVARLGVMEFLASGHGDTALQNDIVSSLDDVVDKINRIEIMREQVENLRKAHGADKALDSDLAAIYDKMYTTELHYLSRTEMHSDDKWYVEKYKIYLNLVWLLGEVGGGASDVMGGAGYGPTNASKDVYENRLAEMSAARTAFDQLMRDVAAFNKAHAGRLPAISDQRSR